MLNQFKKARLVRGITQKDLAERLGVSQVSVCQWETGKSKPSPKRLLQVADILQIPVEKLISERKGKVAG